MSHVTIVGSGIAAIAAAIEASAKGASVTLVRGRPGATALSSGAWDIAGDPARYPDLKWHEGRPAGDCLRELVRRRPQHPYALLSQNESCGEIAPFLEQAINRVSSALDLRLRGGIGKKMLLIHPLGGVKSTSFASPNLAVGNFFEMREARLLIVGFRGLPQFSAGQVGLLLGEVHRRQGFPYLTQIRTTEIAGLPPAISPIALAGRLDDDRSIETLYHLLLREAEKNGATHIALPPVIGIRKTDHILSRLREGSGLAWFESLGLPPSLPGLRLRHAIDRLLEGRRSQWTVVEGEAAGAVTKNRRVTEIKGMSIDRLILATGRYLGGGIVRERSFREPVLDLPLFGEGVPLKEVGSMTSERFLDDHPLFSAGVRVNRNLQPVGHRGEVLYENLWVAGSLIGGYNPAVQHCGMGVAVGTGTMAGRLASS